MLRKQDEQIHKTVQVTGMESAVAEAVFDIVRNVLAEAAKLPAKGEHRLFPNGVGLLEVQATVEVPKFTVSARIADVQYTSPPKPTYRAVRILGVADDIFAYCLQLDSSDDPVMTDCNAFVKKVGTRFSVPIPDKDADGIVDSFNDIPFTKTTMDPAMAMSWANDGLVVAGMKLAQLNPKYGTKYKNGHVTIVHATADPNHPGVSNGLVGRLRESGTRQLVDQTVFSGCGLR